MSQIKVSDFITLRNPNRGYLGGYHMRWGVPVLPLPSVQAPASNQSRPQVNHSNTKQLWKTLLGTANTNTCLRSMSVITYFSCIVPLLLFLDWTLKGLTCSQRYLWWESSESQAITSLLITHQSHLITIQYLTQCQSCIMYSILLLHYFQLYILWIHVQHYNSVGLLPLGAYEPQNPHHSVLLLWWKLKKKTEKKNKQKNRKSQLKWHS